MKRTDLSLPDHFDHPLELWAPSDHLHSTLRVGYLVNLYPKVSHTFIRREIRALEAQGVSVHRYAIRAAHEPLVNPADIEEYNQTQSVLAIGAMALLFHTFMVALTVPVLWLQTLARALRLGHRADRPRWVHLIYLMEACVLLRWTRRDKVHHLHAHFGTNPAMVALLCKNLGGPTYSFTVHGPEELDKATVLSLDHKIADAEFVVAISEFCRSQLYRWCAPELWSKIHVVRCGVDAAYLQAKVTPPEDRPILVCVGRLAPQKGQLLLVEVAAELRDRGRDFELVLVGDGPLRAQIEAKIDEYQLYAHVTITGWASEDTVRAHISRARAVVLPSFAEGLPMAIQEAFALGRPVISTYVAGIPELVSPGKNGWLFYAGNRGGLIQAMQEALDTPVSRLAKMGHAARLAVQAQHDITQQALLLKHHFMANVKQTSSESLAEYSEAQSRPC